MSPKIHHSFWSDSEIEKLTPEQKLAMLWIITNSQMNVCGFCEISERRFCFDTGLRAELLQSTIEALPRALKAFKEVRVVFVRNFIRHQFGDGASLQRNNIFKAIHSAFLGVRHEPLRRAIIEEYPVLAPNPLPSPPKGLEGERTRTRAGTGEGIRIPEEGCGGKPSGVPANEQEAVAWASMECVPADFAATVFHELEGVDWVDSTNGKRSVTNWRSYIRARFSRQQKAKIPERNQRPEPQLKGKLL